LIKKEVVARAGVEQAYVGLQSSGFSFSTESGPPFGFSALLSLENNVL